MSPAQDPLHTIVTLCRQSIGRRAQALALLDAVLRELDVFVEGFSNGWAGQDVEPNGIRQIAAAAGTVIVSLRRQDIDARLI